ncbi:MAG: ribosome biogenesis GTPase Der [Spirochaetales bacterium]|nr:ribosome biogenesis GTPase Der [Spirochaetales bacterium]
MISSLNTEKKVFQVAILGRPNVGKSTLFNRLVGRNRAITHTSPGVTRDTVESRLRIRDLEVTLLDTGGYSRHGGIIEQRVAENSTRIAGDCDLILLLVEAGGLSGEDLDFVERLRRYGDKLILVVNKVDSESQAMKLGEFHALGFRQLIAVSAAHGRNIDELKEGIYQFALRSGYTAGQEPEGREAKRVRLAILGKPNTGKSTLLNRLLRTEKSLVTDIPGTTRDPVEGSFHYRGYELQVVDTAGIRRKSKVREAVEYYSVNRSIKTIEDADVVVLVIDAAEGITEQDKKITALAARRGRGIILVLNKWDRLVAGQSKARAEQLWRELRDRTRFLFPTLGYTPALRISALTGLGVQRLLDTVVTVFGQLNRKVATPRLNQLLQAWVREYTLPVRGRNVKIRYATQTGVNPVRFLFFVNDLKGYPKRYNQYLTGRIRRDLGFDKIPLFIEVRES